MKKFLLLFTLISHFWYSQSIDFKAEGFAISKKINGKFELPTFEKDNSLIVLDSTNDQLIFFRKKTLKISILKADKTQYLSNGDELKQMYGIDEENNLCKIRFISIKEKHPKRKYDRQIYVEFDSIMFIFNVN